MGEFTQDLIAPGVAGVDLLHPTDLIPKTKLARETNLRRTEEGALTARPGLEALATGGVDHLAVARLNDGPGFTRVWAIDQDLYVGQAGALALVDSGYSGRPPSMLPYRPPLSADPWTYIGDDDRMRKVRSDGLDLPIGLSPAPSPVTSALAAELRTNIETFNSAAGWAFNAGTGSPLFPGVRIIAEPGKVGNCLTYSIMPGASGPNAPFFQFFIKNFSPINLNLVGGQPASDDDIIHLWIRFTFPEVITEIKLYLITSQVTDTETLPGTDETGAQNNSDAYVKALRPSDFGPFILPDPGLSISPAIPSGQRRVANRITESSLERQDDTRGGVVELRRQMREGARIRADQVITPKLAWTELGVIGVPLRRGDFLRIGTDEGRSWGNVNGICLLVESTGSVEEFPPGSLYAACSLDDLYLVGGRGPDTTNPGNAQYDYRSISVDITTGAKSNPSPIQPAAAFKDARRQGINVTPPAYADPDYPAAQLGNIRQDIYRRGGTLVENWYLVGRNAANGATFLDTVTDANAQTAGTLELDNFQPVHTVDDAGVELDAVPIPSIWGPVQDLVLGCGDPNRPGHVYWCKPGNADSWPSENNAEVCSPSTPLVNGFFIAGRSFVFSTKELHDLLINLTGNASVTPLPTQCKKGLHARRGLVVMGGLCYFYNNEAIYRTAGGPPEDISSADLFPLFNGESKNGYPPIDKAFPDAIRLETFNQELWFWFRGTDGNIQCWVYSLLWPSWRAYHFANNVTSGYAEEGEGYKNLVLLSTEGQSFLHAGNTDNGVGIPCLVRSGCLDQGLPRDYKLYGDAVFDIDRGQHPITVRALLDNETRQAGGPQVIGYESLEQFGPVGGGRQRYTLDLFGIGSPLNTNKARNVCFEVTWVSDAAGQPKLYTLGPSFIIQPDVTIYRPTDWDFGGRLTDKWIKGVLIECDVFGRTKQVNVEADEVVIAALTIQPALGRHVYEFSFPQQMGRILRLHPAPATQGVPWALYKYDWIFDEEPLQLQRWETQEVDHGIPGWHYPLWAWISLRAPADVTLTIQPYREAGSPINTGPLEPYTIPATGAIKRKCFVPFVAEKGVLFKYILTSPLPFHLHREESSVIVQPWGASDSIETRPFGNDDLSEYSRSMRSARLTAAKGGGGQ
jgi:hypothetical protein